ncbi:hypothetical protein DsansV1_C35g0227491 [Dioscorea sansibarensis]
MKKLQKLAARRSPDSQAVKPIGINAPMFKGEGYAAEMAYWCSACYHT